MIDNHFGVTVGNNGTFGSDSGVGSTITLLEARLPAAQERRRALEQELAAVTAQIDAMTGVLEGLRTLAATPLDHRGEPAAPARPTASSAAPQTADEQTATAESDAKPVPAPTRTPRKRTGQKNPATTTAEKKTNTRKSTAHKTVSPKNTDPASAPTVTPTQPTAAAKKTTAKAAAKKTAKAAKGTTPKTAAKKTPAAGNPPVAAVSDAPTPGQRRSVADADSVLSVLAKMAGPLRAREVAEELGLEAVAANVNAIRTQLERLAKAGRAQRTGRGQYAPAGQSAVSG
ncbi:hypothetical protein [Kitasatospora sp. NPDC002040]|uniref:hypothetical protein n=1 Tax=Kitasatospora sp. NPDC002040 TaxID=3154661 RepID=UPI00332D37E4